MTTFFDRQRLARSRDPWDRLAGDPPDRPVDATLKVFIGYDARESIAFHVLAHSILSRTSLPVSIVPLMSQTVAKYTRPRDPRQSTDFSFTRFLVPYLSGYEGVSIFMDCDMLLRADLAELGAYVSDDCAVYCCPHDYTPTETTKFLGQPQTAYPRKNWSSFMVFRNARCMALTPAYVNTASAADLHRFAWVPDDKIGSLPLAWNYLIGEPNQTTDPPKNLHWTQGGPWFPEYAEAPYAEEWRAALQAMTLAAVPVGV